MPDLRAIVHRRNVELLSRGRSSVSVRRPRRRTRDCGIFRPRLEHFRRAHEDVRRFDRGGRNGGFGPRCRFTVVGAGVVAVRLARFSRIYFDRGRAVGLSLFSGPERGADRNDRRDAVHQRCRQPGCGLPLGRDDGNADQQPVAAPKSYGQSTQQRFRVQGQERLPGTDRC